MIKTDREKRMKLKKMWSWKANGETIWKCRCECGGTCYVKDRALMDCIVLDCGCGCSAAPPRRRGEK